jgi:hypothetical protein
MPRGGHNKFKPTDADYNTVKSMAAGGFTHESIARCLGVHGIDKKTLYRHFRDELDTSLDKANATIANVAYQAAARGEAWAVCFWLKCRARWKEVSKFEHTGPDGAAIDIEVNYVSATEQLRSGIARVAGRKPAERAPSGD